MISQQLYRFFYVFFFLDALDGLQIAKDIKKSKRRTPLNCIIWHSVYDLTNYNYVESVEIIFMRS